MEFLNVDGTRVPKLGLGTWQLTGSDCTEAVRDALELGYRHVDTAQMYDNEKQVGDGIAASGVDRAAIFLTTKVWWDKLAHDRVIESTEASLSRLGTEYVDLLLIHWPNSDVPLSETLDAMQQLQQGGKARHLGVSNFTPELLEDAAGRAPIVCNQVEYHPFLGQDRVLAAARAHGMMVTAYSPLAQGKVNDDPVLAEIAADHDATPAQVALRWLTRQDRVAAIPKAGSAEHRRANFDSLGLELDDDEMARISGLACGRRLVDPEFAPDW